MQKGFITGYVDTPLGKVPQIATLWSYSDIWDTIKVRCSVGRMNYRVNPGLYATGIPDENSSIFISANYKLSFDYLRRALHRINAWVLVLDTKGINVWCAAGKGTFGTNELVFRLMNHKLGVIVKHRKIIVPQLGATGVSAHEVKKQSGFRVIYGPVRADDINAFIARGFNATPDMRRVKFPLKERLKLIPVELAYGKYYLLLIPALFFILSGLNVTGYSVDLAWTNGGKAVANLLVAYLSGCLLTPVFLPYIPFTRFSMKGLFMGWITVLLMIISGYHGKSVFEIISWILISGGISSFLAMNFTGSSTFTSLSGVKKEMKTALPLQVAFTGTGCIGWIITRFV